MVVHVGQPSWNQLLGKEEGRKNDGEENERYLAPYSVTTLFLLSTTDPLHLLFLK